VLDQFNDEESEVMAEPCDNVTAVMQRQQICVESGAVCIETSFGLESDEPRTHIYHDTQTDDQLRSHFVPGFSHAIFSYYLLICPLNAALGCR